MKVLKFALIASTLFFAPSIQIANAETKRNAQTSYRADPQYEFMVRAATSKRSDTFRFGRFRMLYAETSQYDPIGEDIIEQMQKLAFTVQNSKDEDSAREALDDYRALVMEHMANLRIIVQAQAFATIDQRFGSPDFFLWLRRGIMRNVLDSGDGNKLRSAYRIITLAEEEALMTQLGFRIVDTKSAEEGVYHYNMHDAEDLRNGQINTVFVDTSTPLEFLEKNQEERAKTIDIKRQ